jgi:2-polyprenyl-3-methyl-5-hydroxy-6-metoxy-1,4-benzoquinol methylase
MIKEDDYRQRLYARYLTLLGVDSFESLRAALTVRAPYCRNIVRKFLPVNREISILDLGCGDGAFLHYAREAGYPYIRGIDHSPEQVEAARLLGVDGVELGECLETLKRCGTRSTDVVVTLDLIEHLPKAQLFELGAEISRVLRPGGRWIIKTPNGESPLFGRVRYGDLTHELAFTSQSLRQFLFACGFGRAECFEDGPVAHGVKSAIRWVAWRLLDAALRSWLMVESGPPDTRPIFTQNLFCVAEKSAD